MKLGLRAFKAAFPSTGCLIPLHVADETETVTLGLLYLELFLRGCSQCPYPKFDLVCKAGNQPFCLGIGI